MTPPATSTRKIGIPANEQPNVPGMLSRNASPYQECLENASPYLNSFSGERKSCTSVNIFHHSADRGWTQRRATRRSALMIRHLSIYFFHFLHLKSTVSDNHFPYGEVEVFCNCLMPEMYVDMIQCEEWFHNPP